MHEASLVTKLLTQVEELARANSALRVTEVNLELGLLSGVEPVLLCEAFERMKADSCAGNAKLVINDIGVQVECLCCQETATSDRLRFDCPRCGSVDTRVVKGDEVTLVSITIES